MTAREETNSTTTAGPTEGESTIKSPKLLARIAGVFYLLVAITGGFSEGFLDPSMYVAGDGAATARNILANPELVRMGVVAHLVDAVQEAVQERTHLVIARDKDARDAHQHRAAGVDQYDAHTAVRQRGIKRSRTLI